ncbi:MAG: hypothetical protein WD044_11550 [Dongiaceae bacterium]
MTVIAGALWILCGPDGAAAESGVEEAWSGRHITAEQARDMEEGLIERFPDMIVRDGNILSIVGDNGTVAIFENNPCDQCDGRQLFRAIGYLESLAFIVIVEHGWEWSNKYVVHGPTGDKLRIPMAMHLSPSKQQFSAANSGDLQFGMVGVTVGHVDAAGIVVDYAYESSCYHGAEWVSEDRIQLRYNLDELHIVSSDTHKLLKECALVKPGEYDAETLEPFVWLVRESGTWQLRSNQSLTVD